MELYTGTRSRGDKHDLNRIVQSLSSVDRVVSPEPEDFSTADQLVATYSRRHGHITPRDHANDILIALAAWRAQAQLYSVNRQDTERWQRLMHRSGKRFALRTVEA